MSHLQKLLEKAEGVRKETLTSYDIREIEVYASGFNTWLRDHPTPGPSPIWRNAIFECNVLAESSFFMAVHGLYEQASASLRSVLDGFLARLYWDIKFDRDEIRKWEEAGRSTNEYARWELGLTRSYPSLWQDVFPKLQSHSLIAGFDKEFQLFDGSKDLLGTLNLYVHDRPTSRHYGGATRSSSVNVQFKEKHFREWYRDLKSIHAMVGQYSILMYPLLLSANVGQSLRSSQPDVFSRVEDYVTR